ncbi:MAG: hypothetical protein ACLPLR_06550 [Terriglobales bacterium]
MSTAKMIFGLIVFAMLVLLAFKVIPPYFSNYELEDSVKTEALQSTYSTRTEDDIREAVIKDARGDDIALTPKQVHVTRVGGIANGSITIEVDYSVPLDLPGYSTSLDFHISSRNKGLY